jgi:hypothetical protein
MHKRIKAEKKVFLPIVLYSKNGIFRYIKFIFLIKNKTTNNFFVNNIKIWHPLILTKHYFYKKKS